MNGLGPGPERALDAARSAHPQLRRPGRPRGTIALLDAAAAVFSVLARDACLGAPRLGAARGRLRALRPPAAGGGLRSLGDQPLRPQLGAASSPSRAGTWPITTALAVALAFAFPRLHRAALGIRTRRRLHPGHVRRPLPARHTCRHRPRRTGARLPSMPSARQTSARRRAASNRPQEWPSLRECRCRPDAHLRRRALVGARAARRCATSADSSSSTMAPQPRPRRELERLSREHGRRAPAPPAQPRQGRGRFARASPRSSPRSRRAKGVLVIDADGQHPPSAIPSLLAAAARGRARHRRPLQRPRRHAGPPASDEPPRKRRPLPRDRRPGARQPIRHAPPHRARRSTKSLTRAAATKLRPAT